MSDSRRAWFFDALSRGYTDMCSFTYRHSGHRNKSNAIEDTQQITRYREIRHTANVAFCTPPPTEIQRVLSKRLSLSIK